MSTEGWTGHYFDGQTALSHHVTISLTSTGLEIHQGEARLLWKYEALRLTSESPSQPLQFENQEKRGERLVIGNLQFLSALEQITQRRWRPHWSTPAQTLRQWLWLGGMLTFIILSLPLIYYWGIPWASQFLAESIPLQWEAELGQNFYKALTYEQTLCTDEDGQNALNHIAERLAPAQSSLYDFQITVIDSPMINAFALPGGQILIYQGLLERASSPEALAGVLAHEMQHITARHGLQNIIRVGFLAALAGAIAGDFSSLRNISDFAQIVGFLSYSRDFEREADIAGAERLQAANLPLEPMLEMYRILQEASHQQKIPPYLSTHPDLSERLLILQSLNTSEKPSQALDLLDEADWAALQNICQAHSKASAGSSNEPNQEFAPLP